MQYFRTFSDIFATKIKQLDLQFLAFCLGIKLKCNQELNIDLKWFNECSGFSHVTDRTLISNYLSTRCWAVFQVCIVVEGVFHEWFGFYSLTFLLFNLGEFEYLKTCYSSKGIKLFWTYSRPTWFFYTLITWYDLGWWVTCLENLPQFCFFFFNETP